MDHKEILRLVDHTLLRPDAAWEEVKAVCEDALAFKTASVCIPPAFVHRAEQLIRRRIKICTVVGFPNGYSTTEVKVFETEEAIRAGADEIDMVVNLGLVKEGGWDSVLQEIRAVRQSCAGRVLKVIAEACLLTREEKLRLCRVVSQAGADFIKTSTGFSSGGATVEDVALFRANVAPGVKVKAAGGIRTWEDAQRMLDAGADRLGSSSLVALAKAEEKND